MERTDVHIRAVLNKSRDRQKINVGLRNRVLQLCLSCKCYSRIYSCNKLFAGASVSPIWGSRRAVDELYAVFTAKGDAKNEPEEYY